MKLPLIILNLDDEMCDAIENIKERKIYLHLKPFWALLYKNFRRFPSKRLFEYKNPSFINWKIRRGKGGLLVCLLPLQGISSYDKITPPSPIFNLFKLREGGFSAWQFKENHQIYFPFLIFWASNNIFNQNIRLIILNQLLKLNYLKF